MFADFVDGLQSQERRSFVAASLEHGRKPSPWACVDLDTMLLRTQTPWFDGVLRHGMTSHFQPIVDVRTGDTVAHEALARGWHQELNLSGGQILEAARAHGRSMEFDARARENAFAVASRSIVSTGGLFVNVFPTAFTDAASDMAKLADEIDAFELRRDRVTLELLESGDAADDVLLVEVAHAARREGIKVALDDVGAGNNTLSHIDRVRPDYVKFDRALCPVTPTEADVSLFVGVVDYAHSKGAVVVAEGIETEAQYRTAMDCGADMAQGYYIGRPGPAPDLEVPACAV
ncbi:MAG: EAL domain-containing protein [Fimbriimonadaceae bacterium]|nr:EAL domain-containing protein [Fimbriimonadaceae bacterium]